MEPLNLKNLPSAKRVIIQPGADAFDLEGKTIIVFRGECDLIVGDNVTTLTALDGYDSKQDSETAMIENNGKTRAIVVLLSLMLMWCSPAYSQIASPLPGDYELSDSETMSVTMRVKEFKITGEAMWDDDVVDSQFMFELTRPALFHFYGGGIGYLNGRHAWSWRGMLDEGEHEFALYGEPGSHPQHKRAILSLIVPEPSAIVIAIVILFAFLVMWR